MTTRNTINIMYYNRLRNLVNPQKIKRAIYISSMNVGKVGGLIGGLSVGISTEAEMLKTIRGRYDVFSISLALTSITIGCTIGFAGGFVIGALWPVSLLGLYITYVNLDNEYKNMIEKEKNIKRK